MQTILLLLTLIQPVSALASYTDRERLSLNCIVAKLKPKISRKGNSYFTFTCQENNMNPTVFSFGAPDFSNGDTVKVVGVYEETKIVGRHAFHNEIKASQVTVQK